MLEAFFWGALGASALLLGAVVAYVFAPGRQVIGVVMALGTGLLIGSVSFELIDEALKTSTVAWVGLLVLVGATAFAVGSWLLVDRRGGAERKNMEGKQAEGAPLAIVLGSVLDGIPESFVLGLTVLQGGISVSLFAGIALSNFPEGMASSSGLKAAGWPQRKVLLMWLAVLVVSAVAALIGYVVLDPESGRTGAMTQAFAAGALLAMVADTLLPEAFEAEGVWTGLLVVVGFAVSIVLSAI
jgi:zinc transporter, ZIP family